MSSEPSRNELLADIKRLQQELSKVKADSNLSIKQYSLLFQNLPLGAQEEDYSPIKKEVDKLIAKGVDNIAEYFLNNPILLRDLISRVKTTSVNRALLDIHGADSKEEFFLEEVNIHRGVE